VLGPPFGRPGTIVAGAGVVVLVAARGKEVDDRFRSRMTAAATTTTATAVATMIPRQGRAVTPYRGAHGGGPASS
jgi:hypothetical protein